MNATYPLHAAVRAGDIKKVKVLFKRSPSLAFTKDENGQTLLHLASAEGHTNIAGWLLANRADVNAHDKTGATPLHLAAYNGRKDLAKLLLSNDADVNAKDIEGRIPLHDAAFKGHTDVVGLLLANKSDVNATTHKGTTPFQAAAKHDHKDVMKLLLENQAYASIQSARVLPSASEIKLEADKLLAKVGLAPSVNIIKAGTIILTPELRARLMNPVTGEMFLIGQNIKRAFFSLKKKADAGDEEALGILYDAAVFGTVVLDSLQKLVAEKGIAHNKSIWPVMSSSDDTMIKRNEETFTEIGLGKNPTSPRIPNLLKQETSELYWAVEIWTEMNRLRDFVQRISPEIKDDLFKKATSVAGMLNNCIELGRVA
jgi:hypothetical protein